MSVVASNLEKRFKHTKQILKRDTALATAAIYDSMFAAEDGTVPATFQVIFSLQVLEEVKSFKLSIPLKAFDAKLSLKFLYLLDDLLFDFTI